MKRKRALFISYDGMTDALGKSQVLSYLSGLSANGHAISLISFEKPERASGIAEIRALCNANNISWYPLSYHRKPPVISTLYDLYQMRRLALKLAKEKSIELVHCRGYISALVGEYLQKKAGIKYIFDMRGWWADEKTESGAWEGGLYRPVYRYFKKKEMDFFCGANAVVSLTKAGEQEIIQLRKSPLPPIGVVPTCVNFDYFPLATTEFKAEVRSELGWSNDVQVMVYSGALGGNYPVSMLFDIYAGVKKKLPDAKLLILSKDGDVNIPSDMASDVLIKSVEYHLVHRYLAAADFALIYYLKTFSGIGRSPTKLGEYWAVGLPVMAQSGIGDLDYLAQKYPGGLFLMPETGIDQAANSFEELLTANTQPGQLRAYATDYFSLEKGVAFYDQLYDNI